MFTICERDFTISATYGSLVFTICERDFTIFTIYEPWGRPGPVTARSKGQFSLSEGERALSKGEREAGPHDSYYLGALVFTIL